MHAGDVAVSQALGAALGFGSFAPQTKKPKISNTHTTETHGSESEHHSKSEHGSSPVAFLFPLAILVFFVYVAIRAQRKGPKPASSTYTGVARNGLRARALVLSASSYSFGVTTNGTRYEKRTMTLDVEIDGTEPYEVTGDFLVPRGLAEAIPGASLDVAVDPDDRSNVSILGPGGVTGPWLVVGPPNPY